MTVKAETRSGITVVHLSGDLDARHCIRSAEGAPDLSENGMRVVLDMQDVPFVNSGGISELVELTAATNSHGGRLILASPSPFFERVLQTTQLDRFFTVAPTVDEAIDRLMK